MKIFLVIAKLCNKLQLYFALLMLVVIVTASFTNLKSDTSTIAIITLLVLIMVGEVYKDIK